MIKRLEKQIRGHFIAVKNGGSPSNINIGAIFARLRPLDEALYTDLIVEYKRILSEREVK